MVLRRQAQSGYLFTALPLLNELWWQPRYRMEPETRIVIRIRRKEACDLIEWTDKVLVALKDGWSKGYSATEISHALYRRFSLEVSRSAVLGKLHRLGLQRRGYYQPRSAVPREETREVIPSLESGYSETGCNFIEGDPCYRPDPKDLTAEAAAKAPRYCGAPAVTRRDRNGELRRTHWGQEHRALVYRPNPGLGLPKTTGYTFHPQSAARRALAGVRSESPGRKPGLYGA